jgi:hypothetical protein
MFGNDDCVPIFVNPFDQVEAFGFGFGDGDGHKTTSKFS